MTSELSEVREREVMGPEVRGDRMSARNGLTMDSGARDVRSAGGHQLSSPSTDIQACKPLSPTRLRLSSTNPSMRSPSSPLSRPDCPFLLLLGNEDADELLPRRSDGGKGAADVEKEAALAHRWFRRMDEVTV